MVNEDPAADTEMPPRGECRCKATYSTARQTIVSLATATVTSLNKDAEMLLIEDS